MSVSQDTSVPEDRPGCGDKPPPGQDQDPRRLQAHRRPRQDRRLRRRHSKSPASSASEAPAPTSAARRIKRESETDRDRGELQEPTTIAFLRFLDEWVERYRGQGRRGFRENTRDEYRRLIANYAHPYFSSKLKLVDVTTFQLARFVDWLADEDEQGKRLSDSTIANIVIPLRAALTTAKREGLIRHNPSPRAGAAPPRGDRRGARKRSRCSAASSSRRFWRWRRSATRLLFEVLATTAACGSARRSRSSASTLQIDGSTPEVCVRRAIVKGRIEPPKTKYGRREVRLPASLVYRLRAHLAAQEDQDSTALVFTNREGNVRSSPATFAAGASSRWSRRSTRPGRASTRSATRSPRSI